MENILFSIYALGGIALIVGMIIAFMPQQNTPSTEAAEAPPKEPANVHKQVARVKCNGTSKAARTKFTYEGINDCFAASKLIGGAKLCPYACIGLGTCASVCESRAISLKDGIAYVNPKNCTACGKCAETCPKKVIGMFNAVRSPWVKCSSRNQSVVVQKICDTGCINCRNCETACQFGAITIEKDLARIDQTKCRNCAACISKCSRRTIAI